MLNTPPRSSTVSPISQAAPAVDTPVHRYSRRLRGLSPEAIPLELAQPRTPSGEMTTAGTSQVTVEQPRIPETFHGEVYEDVEDWLEQYERVAKANHWTVEQKLSRVYVALADSARTWYENREDTLSSWDAFRQQLFGTLANRDRHESAQQLIESRIQKPNESVAMFAVDMTCLYRRADSELPEAKKLRYLMRGVKEQLFAGFLRNPPTTVAEFIKEATTIERALQQRCRYHDRPNGASINVSALTAGSECSLRDSFARSFMRRSATSL
ncbi:activity-regulated cytoskeleton-associated protein-like [Rhipicephalus sanguineus]|uniref:activity-regulated cytoskeleton-associated protein-like n=1 Tax=Rhipicephalus sanguineus TaxID=34632 RepID=UPI001895722A|nr:activity-regulated cytoskeleton-associated protein-like [Rhipicephalus sanguineus]